MIISPYLQSVISVSEVKKWDCFKTSYNMKLSARFGAYVYNLNTWEIDAGGSGVQDHFLTLSPYLSQGFYGCHETP